MKNGFSALPVLKTDKYYSTQELSKLFHANESTIKRWADSGKLKCFKTPGGHRKYTPDSVSEFITNFHYEIISFDADFTQKEENELLEFLISKGDFRTLSEVYFSQACKAEKANLYSLLHGCHSASIPLVTIYDEIVAKAVKKIFNLRNQSKISLTEEFITKNSMLESLFQFRLLTQKVFSSQRTVLLASAKSGIQEVVLSCAEHLLTMAGWKVLNLGANTNVEIVKAAIIAGQPQLICVCKDYLGEESGSTLLTTAIENKAQILFSNLDSYQNIFTTAKIEEITQRSFSSFNEMLSLIFKHR
ncbi:MAG: helix-turn-helix domain-containing protein [Ignavibacteriae bacterium]|nr:helix-turn-helix domain-containing protein [Ignavibacteriota bacterium]